MKRQILIIGAFGLCYTVWGSTFLVIHFGLEQFPPFLMGAFRFLFAGMVLGGCLLMSRLVNARKTAVLIPSVAPGWIRPALSGIFLAAGGNGLLIWAEQGIPSGLASLWIATVPIWVLLLNWLLFRQAPPRLAAITGCALGVLGVSLLPSASVAADSDYSRSMYIIALLLAAIFWSLGTLVQSHNPRKGPLLWTATVQMSSGGFVLLLMSLICGEWASFYPETLRLSSILAVLYLAVVGSVITLSAYSWLLGAVSPQKVATYALVNPVLALMLGSGFAGEAMSGRIYVASALVIAAVGLILFTKREPLPIVGLKMKKRTNMASCRSSS